MSAAPSPACSITPAIARPRQRLLDAATCLYALWGYSGTSIRDIAHAAETNPGAISYHFGAKDELYRAAFRAAQPSMFNAGTPCRSLRDFYAAMLAPLCQGKLELMRLKLYYREWVEPSGLLDAAELTGPDTPFGLLSNLLTTIDNDERPAADRCLLTTCLLSLALHVVTTPAAPDALQGRRHVGTDAIAAEIERLTLYAEAMVHAHRRRRAGGHA